jgi:hypothetical protein
MIDYQKQLDLKRVAVQKAFEHFSGEYTIEMHV